MSSLVVVYDIDSHGFQLIHINLTGTTIVPAKEEQKVKYFSTFDAACEHLIVNGYVDVSEEIRIQSALGLIFTVPGDTAWWRKE